MKPGRKPDADGLHKREAVRFCAACLDENWTPERTSELCLILYGVLIPPGVILSVFGVIKKAAESRAIKTPDIRTENDLMVS